MSVRVVVVLLSLNQKALTIDCIQSLTESEPEAPQIVLVDNSSSDGTLAAVRDRFPGVEAIRAEENLGMAAGRNIAIRRALALGAEYIWSIDNDTLIPPDASRALELYMDRHPEVGICAATVCWGHDPDRVWARGGRFNWLTGESLHPERNRPYADLPRGELDADWICGCNMFIRTDVLRECGAFDERFFCYFEDVDLSLRVRRRGHRLVSLHQPRILHHHRSALGAASPRTTYFVMRNRFLLMELHASARQRLLFHLWWRAQFYARFLPGRLLAGDITAIRATRLALRDYRQGNWCVEPDLPQQGSRVQRWSL